jgi:TolB-like protein
MTKDTDQADLPPSGDRVALLWRRLKEHRIAQWSVGYVAVAYGIQHAVTLTSEALEWPHGIERASMILLALGLPLAMALAWYHGERASRGYSRAEFSILSVLLVIGAFLFYVFVRPSEQIAARPATAAQAVTAATPVAKAAGISVAVLPFLNLSGDPKEEYFSDGMTEEITSALAKIPNLPVVGRTSAFAFKGKNEDLRVIGQALGAAYLIEGSVRKDGSELRITAQLIKSDDGRHLWTDSYDRELKGVFAVQEDVARAIAAALQVPLGLKEGETLVSNRTGDTQSYEDYLRALALYRARSIKDVIAVLEPMVKRDPTYAPAWALLSQAYSLEPIYLGADWRPVDELRRDVQSAFGKSDVAARKAIQLDPKYTAGYSALGYLETARGHWAEADGDFGKALALDPTDPDTLHLYANALMLEGRLKQTLEVRTALRKLEPFVPIYNVYAALAMQLNGDLKGGIALLEGLSPVGPVGAQRNSYLALGYASEGRYALAADTMLMTTPDQELVSVPDVKQAADIIRKAPGKIGPTSPSPVTESPLSFVYAFAGAPERYLDALERQAEVGQFGFIPSFVTFHPSLSDVRKTERFKTMVRKIGLVDYWRAKGWPDLCHPTTGDDFACN